MLFLKSVPEISTMSRVVLMSLESSTADKENTQQKSQTATAVTTVLLKRAIELRDSSRLNIVANITRLVTNDWKAFH